MENIENQTSIELVYDEELIRELICDIIKDCSYRETRTDYRTVGRTYRNAYDEIKSATNLNGDKIYENICNFFGTGEYRSGEGEIFIFRADALFSPQLVTFLMDMINGEEVDYNWFINREEIKEKEKVELAIKQLDEKINGISNFQTEWKIMKLKDLAWYLNKLESLSKVDYDVLNRYYDLAEQYISVGLVQEKTGLTHSPMKYNKRNTYIKK